ncbi:MAG: ferritin family protein [Planctomycetaceae bacterium]|nr:ferritin family protein [Planctomycetaceae bacterium]
MEFKSMPEILRFALGKEKASHQFYMDVTARVKDVITRSIFEAIAGEEQKHIEAIELELMKIGVTVYPEAQPGDEVEWQERLEMDEAAENMDYRMALVIAIQKEKAAFQLYTQVLGMVAEPEYRTMFMELAEQEMRHIIQFEREHQAMS